MQQETLEQEFIAAFEAYGDAIFRFCMVKVSNVELAEDMTQEVFSRYWQYLRKGEEMHNTRAFLYTIANNMAKDWYKKKKATSLDDQLEIGHEPAASEASPEVSAAYQELLSTIRTLEEKDAEVLLLTHVEGLPPRDIAELLGETANAISVRLNRATKRLHSKLHV